MIAVTFQRILARSSSFANPSSVSVIGMIWPGPRRRLLDRHDEDRLRSIGLIKLGNDGDIDLKGVDGACAFVADLAVDKHRDRAESHRRLDGVVVGRDDDVLC